MGHKLLLQIGKDPSLRKTRGDILRERWHVVDAHPDEAWQIFRNQDFDVVVLCSSLSPGEQTALIDRISAYSPSTVIVSMGDVVEGGAHDGGAIFASKFQPETLNETISLALRHPPTSISNPPIQIKRRA